MSPNPVAATVAAAPALPHNPLAPVTAAASAWRRETSEPALWFFFNVILGLALLALVWTPKVLIWAALGLTPVALIVMVLLTTGLVKG
ncbi:MAG: hypothetical protein ACOY3L_16920 [Pseudomonadota bacterium]